MPTIEEILRAAKEAGASDVHLTVGIPPKMRVNGNLITMDYPRMLPADTLEVLVNIMTEVQRERFEERGEYDMSFSIPNCGRYRVNAYKQRGSVALAFRLVGTVVPSPEELGVPESVVELYQRKRGLVLVTGPTGSGKSTTLAAIIDKINNNRDAHVITLEDPIEYLHQHKMSMVNQREIGIDSNNYANALRAALREDPDVILVGEMRDFETISVAITAAETGHLVLSTLHTIGAASTIVCIIDVFPPNQQHQIAVQLSMVLQAVISQQLVPSIDEKMIPVFEIMTVTPAIRNMIRDNKIPQLEGIISSSASGEIISMDSSLLTLYKEGQITAETALAYATNPELLKRKM